MSRKTTVGKVALALATLGFLAWTAGILVGPIQSKSRNDNRLAVAERLNYVEKALQDLITGTAIIPPEPRDEALRRWRVLFITYRKQVEQLRSDDPALSEIADYLGQIYTLVDRAEMIRKDILAGKIEPEQIEVRDRDFRKYLEAASAEARAAVQSLHRTASRRYSSLLGFPYYPLAAGILAALLGTLLFHMEWRRDQSPPVEVMLDPKTGQPLPEEIAALLREPYFEPGNMEPLRRLAGRFAHNFNNLLTTINGYTDLVLYSMEEKDPNRNDLEEVKKAGERAAFLTSHLLAFSGHQVAKPTLVDLSELVRNLQGSLRSLLGPASRLDLDLTDDLDHVQVDPAQFRQVVLSLAGNARDAMPHGGCLSISTSNAKTHQIGGPPRPCRKPCVIVTFKDTGVAMDEQTRNQIFEPFFTTHEIGKGTGLGLSAAYGIIRQNGGTIRVISEKGQGATFTVYFPSGGEGEWAGAAQFKKQPARFRIGSMRPGR